MIKGTLTLNYLSHVQKTFTPDGREPVTFIELTAHDPDSRTGIAKFTMDQNSDIKVLDKLEPMQEVTFPFLYKVGYQKYTVTIDDKSKDIFPRKVRLVLSTQAIP